MTIPAYLPYFVLTGAFGVIAIILFGYAMRWFKPHGQNTSVLLRFVSLR